MGKTSFNSMRDLSKKVHKKIEKLEEGELSLEELETLVSNAQELYERLLIVKYKAYEKYGDPNLKADDKEEEIVEDLPQIEEEEIAEEPAAEEAFDFSGITEEVQPAFDFAMEQEEIFPKSEDIKAESPKEEKTATDTFPESGEIKTKKDVFKDSHVEKYEPEDDNSLNKKLAEEDALSLRKKLQSTPVKDLKAEISIAKKFEYITFMFDGKNDLYEEAITALNNCADGEEAKDKLNEYSSKYNWDLENKSIIKFVELVERRYL